MPPSASLSPKQTGRAILSKYRAMILGHQSTLLVGAFLMAIPAVWITKVHMDWKPKPDAKKRMLIGQATFWSSMLVGFKVLHAALFALPDRKVLMPAGFFSLIRKLRKAKTRGPAAATLTVITTGFGSFIGSMIGGFEGGIRLGKALFPKPPRPSECSYATSSTTGNQTPLNLNQKSGDSFSPMLAVSSLEKLKPVSVSPVSDNPMQTPLQANAPSNTSPLLFGAKSRSVYKVGF